MEMLKIGVSACLLGAKVRYDGGHRLNSVIAGTLAGRFALVPVCPEVEAGLSVPREPMQLTAGTQGTRLIVITNGQDFAPLLNDWAAARVGRFAEEGICGFILKSRSPSCAIDDADLVSPSGEQRGKTAGLFSAMATNLFPQLPLIDEEDVADPARRADFIDRVSAYHRSLNLAT